MAPERIAATIRGTDCHSRLLIADEHPVVRSALSLSLGDDFDLVAAACDADSDLLARRRSARRP